MSVGGLKPSPAAFFDAFCFAEAGNRQHLRGPSYVHLTTGAFCSVYLNDRTNAESRVR